MIVAETERAPVLAALKRSMRRGWVEYDPTRIVALRAGLLADPARQVPLTVPDAHALLDVLRWTNSTEQRIYWPKDALDALKAVRSRVERGDDAGPEPVAVVAAEEEWALW